MKTALDAVGFLDTDTPATPAPAPAGDEVVLPPFSGDSAVCAKCRYLEAFTHYRPAVSRSREEFNGTVRRGPLPERLERECARCDYKWDEALPGDASPDGGLTADQLAHALDDSTPYPVELDRALLDHMATRLLEATVVLPIPGHPLWQPEEPPPPPVAPLDPDTLATPEA